MSTNFPGTSIDSFPSHSTGDVIQASYDNNEQDAIVALETKVGVNGSAVSSTHDYKLSGVTGTDKAASLAGAESLTNKTLASPKITVGSDAVGDLHYVSNSNGTQSRLGIGTALQQLRTNAGATAPEWFTPTIISDASYAAKGLVEFLTDAATSGITVASGIANVNSGTGNNQIVKLDGSAKLPAVDGSALTNLPIAFGVCSTVGTKGTQSVGATNYADSRGTNATETNVGDYIPVAATMKRLMVNVLTNTFSSSSTTFTIMNNGVATTMTLTFAGGVTGVQSDTTHTFSVSAGDRITLRAVTTNVDSATLTYVFAWQSI